MNELLLSTGLKDEGSRFSYKHAESLQQEEGTTEGETTVQNTCGFLAFIKSDTDGTVPGSGALYMLRGGYSRLFRPVVRKNLVKHSAPAPDRLLRARSFAGPL
jgi:hypothetical protein